MGAFIAGCGGDDDDDDGDGGGGADLGLITEGQLSVGTDTPYPPFELGEPPDISGYDIEVMNGIAEQLGLEVEYTARSSETPPAASSTPQRQPPTSRTSASRWSISQIPTT